MFCYQCEQTAHCTGCTVVGVCGKKPDVAALQDLLIFTVKGLGRCLTRLRKMGVVDRKSNIFIIKALFTTVTNVNFDADRLEQLLHEVKEIGGRIEGLYDKAATEAGAEPESRCCCEGSCLAGTRAGLLEQAAGISIDKRTAELGEDVVGLQELITYGLKGAAAYADHAITLGVVDEKLFDEFNETLNYLAENPTDIGELTAKALHVGEINMKAMENLDKANTDAYGHPEPTAVRITPVAGKCILVSGHDLKDLDALLQQTEGKGINVYTHGEMLPCNAYPGLKKYPHLVGNYGGAWQDQQKEFDAFPGSILMTTNCIQKPRETYNARIFTTGLVAFPNVVHVTRDDFSPVIDAALAAEGFSKNGEEKTIMIGFAHNAVLGVADKVVEAVTVDVARVGVEVNRRVGGVVRVRHAAREKNDVAVGPVASHPKVGLIAV